MQGFDLELATAQMTPASSWTTSLADAVTVNTIIQEGNTIALPLRVRGHVIGAIEFELPPERELSPEDMELVREIGDRFGLAAENTRLLEESLRAAQRESLINEISRRLQSASNVETTLTEAARSLRAALDARQVAIRLGKPETLNGASNGKKGS
jgi:GAF domain-containing protein